MQGSAILALRILDLDPLLGKSTVWGSRGLQCSRYGFLIWIHTDPFFREVYSDGAYSVGVYDSRATDFGSDP